VKTATEIPHGTVTGRKHWGCKCLACCDAYAAYQRNRYRKRAYGTWQPLVDASPAREHLEALHAKGMSWEQMARVSGVLVEDLRRLRMPLGAKPRTERIRPERAELLLSIRFDPSPGTPKGLVSALGTARRLHALRAIGWPLAALAARAGIARHTLAMVTRQATVQEATRAAVVELYDDLHDQDPRRHGVPEASMRRATTWASRQGWAAPNRWYDRDIDIVVTVPGPPVGRRYATPSNGDRRLAIVEDTAELAAVGCTREVIAARLGVTWEAVHRAHVRSGVPVPAALAA
jgi:lambda repressor-like predicted transcriptional regulator